MPASTRDSKLLDGQPLRPARSNMVGGRLCQTGGGQLGLSQTGVKQALMPSGTGGRCPSCPSATTCVPPSFKTSRKRPETRYAERGRRATFYVTGMEHSPILMCPRRCWTTWGGTPTWSRSVAQVRRSPTELDAPGRRLLSGAARIPAGPRCPSGADRRVPVIGRAVRHL